MASPTEIAQQQFHLAHRNLTNVWANENTAQNGVSEGLREGLKNLALGMNGMAVGLRATYQLIEQLQREIQALKQGQRPRP